MLGPIVIMTPDGLSLSLTGATSRALVAALALAFPRGRSVDSLAEDIWGDELPQNPRGSLQTLISRLRAVAGAEFIRSDAGGYALHNTAGIPGPSDLAIAQGLADQVTALPDDDDARLTLLDEALALWRGQPGTDLGRAPVATVLVETAGSLRERLESSRARSLLALGRAKEAASALVAQAEARPFDEPVHVELMTALVTDDRPLEALAVFAAFRERLRDSLGADPGPAASALNTAILQGNRPPGAGHVRIGLRAEPNTLIGRETDLQEVKTLLTRARLVTLLGAGGIGKTRLAQAVAAASTAPVVVVVPLTSIRDNADLAPAIGSALGISEARAGGGLSGTRAQPDLRSRVIALLSERSTLLVLDNCEQIIDGVAEWLADMLAAVPTLRVLTTSRAPIVISGERVHPVTTLSTDPGEGTDEPGAAVQLFLERARAVRPDAVLGFSAVTRLCERLDGLPLAIELAAARVRTMTAEQIEQRLEDRFALLRSGDRSAPERHRTLEAVIEWSWDLLDADARRALARLSLLPGGFSAATAAEVLGVPSVDDLLDRLVAQSLLIVMDDPLFSGIRFRMLETVREFGIARLGTEAEDDAAWDAILDWACGFACMQGARLFGPPGPLRAEVFRVIRSEHDNLVAALRHAINTDRRVEVALIAATLTQSWIVQGTFTELGGFAPLILNAMRGLPVDAVSDDVLASVLVPCAIFTLLTGHVSGPRNMAWIRLLRRRSAQQLSPAWRVLAAVIDQFSQPERVNAALSEARTDSDPSARLVAEILTSQLSENDGDAVTAKAAARRAWELAEQTGQLWFAAMAASSAAQLASQTADPAGALIWFDRAREGFEAFGARDELRQLDWTLGGSLVALGRIEEAHAHFEALTSLKEFTQEGLEFAAIGWFGLAEVQRARGNATAAIAAYERAMVGFRSVDQRSSPWYIIALSGFVSAAALDNSLPDDTLARWARRLRTRVLALERMRSDSSDKPVLGAALVGWSAWAIAFPDLRPRAVEALALAGQLGARQDLPSLHLVVHRARAVEIVGSATMTAADTVASTLSVAERGSRAHIVLSARTH